MTMKIDDTVNIINSSGGHWKGKITKIHYEYTHGPNYSQPIAIISGKDGHGCSVAMESNLEFKDGEWWEVKR